MAREAVDEGERQLGQHPHVEVDHLQLLGAVALGGAADQAEAGIVDDVLRLRAALAKRFADAARGAGLREIVDDDERPRAARARDLVGQCVQAIRAPRHQRQLVAVAREHPRQRLADARGSAGDEGDGPQAVHSSPCNASGRPTSGRPILA